METNHKPNFMDFMADGQLSNRDLRSVEQAGLQAENRLDCDREMRGNGPATPMSEMDWKSKEKDHHDVHRFNRRAHRGSGTTRKSDMAG